MFYHLLLIHLYRPFLKYSKAASPLPLHVSPRRQCSHAASAISKLLRIYKRSYGFDQISSIAVYIAHTACTIHLLNLPERNARRDIVHGLMHAEEMAERWLCARRTLRILHISANEYHVELPTEAVAIFERTYTKWGSWGSWGQTPETSDDSIKMDIAHPSADVPGKCSKLGGALPGSQYVGSLAQDAPDCQGHKSPVLTSTLDMSLAQRPTGVQLQQSVSPLPEPTYLRPVSNMYFPVQIGPPYQQPKGWCAPHDIHRLKFDNGNNISPARDTPDNPDIAENMVEESRDWWSRNPTSLDLELNNLKALEGGIPEADYRAGILSSNFDNGSMPPQLLGHPADVPSTNPPEYPIGTVFPRHFPQ